MHLPGASKRCEDPAPLPQRMPAPEEASQVNRFNALIPVLVLHQTTQGRHREALVTCGAISAEKAGETRRAASRPRGATSRSLARNRWGSGHGEDTMAWSLPEHKLSMLRQRSLHASVMLQQ
jgi:hypothetical protein